ncbi:oxidative DNA demethylase [Pleodorina starrii]|uniref:Oxidative DNA demethylase n=1 Tax=Pleodorina starrii TaxID=330485 RepID=A0A9W6EZF9_9CHLO|nr:oxidative DNA demethylase [Pleodorina starrii]GLC64368.1 oxidative DNA demethylase [Pleodorina starrii]
MSEALDARDGHMDQAEFKKKSQLRAQLLAQLQKGHIVQLGPLPGDKPGLKRHALNSMIADYLAAVQYNYSLSVFKEESGVESRPLLTEEEVLDVLKVDRDTSFYQSYLKSKAHAGSDSCVVLNLLSAISEAAAAKGKETFTQTVGGDRYQLEVRMAQLEQQYQARLRDARMAPGAGMEERLALYRQEIEEQAAAEVARQVERIREMEVAAARLDEASKARRAMESERLELERLHSERLTKLRQREEEMTDKLRRQQRDVENVAYEYRQRILREEERLRNHKTELQQQLDSRQEQLKQLERSLELRERAVATREGAAEKKLADATEASAEAQVAARQDVEREYQELKNGLAQQRMQLEVDRARLMELRSEAVTDLAAARAKEDRLRALETARAEAEARAAAHAADAEVCRLQAEKLAMELSHAREELSRRVAQAAQGADAMLQNAAGAMNMLNVEAIASRSSGSHIRDAISQLERARGEAVSASAQVVELQQERTSLQVTVSALGVEAETLRTQLGRVEALLDEAVAARSAALSSLEEGQFRIFQQEREVSELRSQLSRAKEELAALRMQAAMVAAGRRPPSRGPDSPGHRSIAVSPTRRPPPGGAAATISALSLGIALGGGPGGPLAGGGGGHGAQRHPHSHPQHWQHQHSLGGSVAGGTPPMSNVEFPIAAAPRDATMERLERLRRQEQLVASQEDVFRKRMAVLEEMRNRSLAVTAQAPASGPAAAAGGAAPYAQPGSPLQQHLQADMFPAAADDSPPPYMTYVMHSSPVQGTQIQRQRPQMSPTAANAAQAQARLAEEDEEQQMLFAYHHQQQQHLQQQHYHQQQQQQQHQQQQYFVQQQHQQQREQQQQQYQDPSQYPYTAQQQQQEPPLPPPPPQQQHLTRQHSPPAGTRYSSSGSRGSASPSTGGGNPSRQHPNTPAPAVSQGDLSQSSSLDHPQQPQQQPPYISARSTGMGYGPASSSPQQPQYAEPPPLSQQQQQQGPPPPVEGGPGYSEPPVPSGPPAPGPVVLPPPGLVITSNLRSPAPEAELPPPPAAEPPPAPPKPTIPGLVIVSGFAPKGPGAATPTTAAAAAPPSPPESRSGDLHAPPAMAVEDVMQAKMRMLQEQRERALAAQQHQQPPPLQRRLSRTSQSSRYSGRGSSSGDGHYFGATGGSGNEPSSPGATSTGAGGGGGGASQQQQQLPPSEDSASEIVAGEAYDTVAPELSTIQRRSGLVGRQTSHDGHLSRQSSMNRREIMRNTSLARSEASALSMEVPGLGGHSMKAMSTTLDDIPSSLEGFELPGLNDDDEDPMEAPGGDEDRFGAFAAEFSAGSVF